MRLASCAVPARKSAYCAVGRFSQNSAVSEPTQEAPHETQGSGGDMVTRAESMVAESLSRLCPDPVRTISSIGFVYPIRARRDVLATNRHLRFAGNRVPLMVSSCGVRPNRLHRIFTDLLLCADNATRTRRASRAPDEELRHNSEVVAAKVGARFIEPMLLLHRMADDPSRYQYEIKWDGFRAIALKTGGFVHLRSRNDKDFNGKYPAIVRALAGMPDETGLDGGSGSPR